MRSQNDKGPAHWRRGLGRVVCGVCLLALWGGSLPSGVHAQSSPRKPQVLPVMLNDGDGVRNAGFETWLEGQPLCWRTRPDLEATVTSEDTDVPEGTHAVRCAADQEWNCLRQRVVIHGALAGKTLTLSADVKAYDQDPTHCFVLLILDNGRRLESQSHPGDGNWHTVTLEYTFPADLSPQWVDVVLAKTRGLERECLFDSVRLVVK